MPLHSKRQTGTGEKPEIESFFYKIDDAMETVRMASRCLDFLGGTSKGGMGKGADWESRKGNRKRRLAAFR